MNNKKVKTKKVLPLKSEKDKMLLLNKKLHASLNRSVFPHSENTYMHVPVFFSTTRPSVLMTPIPTSPMYGGLCGISVGRSYTVFQSMTTYLTSCWLLKMYETSID